MKFFIFVFLIATAAAAGSGPYLPSGWRPNGPAFNLPGETEKPSQNLLKDQLFDVEASGSDFLREYGPPKLEVSQDITLQGLPEVETEKPFLVGAKAVDLRADDGVIIENAEIKAEVVAEGKTNKQNVSENIAQIIADNTNTAELSTQDEILIIKETPSVNKEKGFLEQKATEDVQKQTTEENEIKSEVNIIKQEVISEVKEISESVKEDVARINKEVSEVKDEINKVKAEVREEEEQVASGNFQTEVKSQQAKAVLELKSTQEQEISTQNVPEGFLEYEPPGFREYGPPKEDGNQVEEEKPVEINETRRRRFSPKFKATLKRRY